MDRSVQGADGAMFWAWVGFNAFVLAMLAVDLLVFHRPARVINPREALRRSAFWIALSLLFCAGIYRVRGPARGLEYLTGYLIEKSLSIDNLFLFLAIFTILGIPRRFQHRVLFWGILGALAMRGIFIFGGIALIQKFHWILYGFGTFLVLTGLQMALVEKKWPKPESQILKLTRRWLPFTETIRGSRFFVRENGRLLGTPLLLALIVIEVTDVFFAIDSIPAILAITMDPFTVYTSNAFAILGMRSLYFALSGLLQIFEHLRTGLSLILVFVGLKLSLVDFYRIPTGISLAVVLSILAFSVGISAVSRRRRAGPVIAEWVGVHPNDAQIRDLLSRFRKIVIVGLSPHRERPSHLVAKYLMGHGYEVFGVNPAHHEILGRPVYPTLQSVPFPLEIVDVFRRTEHVPALIREMMLLRPQVIWLQEGITHPEAEREASVAGLTVISDLCISKAHARLVRKTA